MAAELMVINPVRRKRRGPRRMTAKQAKYFGKRRKRRSPRVTRARRNPILGSPTSRRRRTYGKIRSGYRRARSSGLGSFIGDTLVPSAIGGGGALLLDMAWGKLPIPDAMKAGPLAPVTRIGLAVGLGYAASMVGGKSFGKQVTNGALIVTMYDLIKGTIAPSVPAAPSSGTGMFLGYGSAARQAGVGMYV